MLSEMFSSHGRRLFPPELQLVMVIEVVRRYPSRPALHSARGGGAEPTGNPDRRGVKFLPTPSDSGPGRPAGAGVRLRNPLNKSGTTAILCWNRA